jgi:hypothetical protein
MLIVISSSANLDDVVNDFHQNLQKYSVNKLLHDLVFEQDKLHTYYPYPQKTTMLVSLSKKYGIQQTIKSY